LPDTALDIVEKRIVDAVTKSPAPNFSVFTNRPDDQPLQGPELPGVVCRIVTFAIGTMPGEEMAQWLITAQVQFDCHSGISAGQTIDATNRQTVSTIISRLTADPTLSGRLIDIMPSGVSGAEMDGADIGTAILDFTVQFITPRGDLSKIIGLGGQHYTS
jgi:hypothetical protein